MSVVIETTIGDITVDLFTEERPIACLNFMKLCKLKYYNYNLFHTIEQGFIAQSGDPTGAGDGGSSIWGVVEGQNKRFFTAESLPKIHHTTAGILSLVGAGKLLVGSQFFITLGENLSSLDGQHCVIGEVVEGHHVLRKLNEAIVDEKFRPYQDIRITHTVILEDPFPDPRGFREPSRSPSPNADRLKNGRIAADEDVDDTEGKSTEEIQEMLAEREAKARATILEIVGDLPDAEMAPPENVLFVCKLNPVTTDDDLEIIFSRFGKVKGCEVIRDRKSGDSLQYAFVEFEEQKSCEAAYFKMDNVLIDDRRIHVDFSQSVSKVKWKGKGRGIEGNSKGLDFDNLRDKDNKNIDFKSKKLLNSTEIINERVNRWTRSSRSPSRERRIAERQRDRKKRHREQEKRRRNSRSRNRSHESNETKERKRSRSRSEKRKTHEKKIVNRTTVNKYSPERQTPGRSFGKKYQSLDSEIYKRCTSLRKYDKYSCAESTQQKKSELKLPEDDKNNTIELTKLKKKNHKKKSKKIKKYESSSSEETHSDSDSTSESSDSTSSNSSDISLRNRKRKKKSKKHKLKKKKSKNSKK